MRFNQRCLRESRILGLLLIGLSLALFSAAGIAGGGGGAHGSIGWSTDPASPSSPEDEVIEGAGPLSISSGWSGGPGFMAFATNGGFYYTGPTTIGMGEPLTWSGSISGIAENDYSVIALLNISNDSDPTLTENINSPVAALQVKGKKKTPQGTIVWFTGKPSLANGTITGQGGTLGQGGDWEWKGKSVTMFAFTTGQGFFWASGPAELDKNGHWFAEIKNVPKGEYTIVVLGIIRNPKTKAEEETCSFVHTKKMP